MISYKFPAHVRRQMEERGITDEEVHLTVESGILIEISANRGLRRRVFTEGYYFRGRRYPHKEITTIYVLEHNFVVLITAIARYGLWKDE